MSVLNTTQFLVKNGANFFLNRLLPSDCRNQRSFWLVSISCILSSIIHATRPQILAHISEWKKKDKVRLTNYLESLAPTLVFLSLYGSNVSILRSYGCSLVLNMAQKKLVPDFFDKATYVEPSKRIAHLPAYVAARCANMLSSVQNLFHLAVYSICQGIGFFKGLRESSLESLMLMITTVQGVGLRGCFGVNYEVGEEDIKGILDALPAVLRNEVYRQVYLIAQPESQEENWGQIHALNDLDILLKAVKKVQEKAALMPYVFYWETNLWTKSHPYVVGENGEVEHFSKQCVPSIGFVNGMGVEHAYAKEYDAKEVQKAYAPRKKMHAVYLATSGKNFWGAIYDYIEAILALSGQPTGVIFEIHAMWDTFFENEWDSQSEFLHFCLSKGSIMTSLALRLYPYPDRVKKIRVIALTPAVFIPEEVSKNVQHFFSRRDIFPWLVPGLREHLFEDGPYTTIVNAPGEETHRGAHDPHCRAYQQEINAYLAKTPWAEILNRSS